jgi:hypothetical protein
MRGVTMKNTWAWYRMSQISSPIYNTPLLDPSACSMAGPGATAWDRCCRGDASLRAASLQALDLKDCSRNEDPGELQNLNDDMAKKDSKTLTTGSTPKENNNSEPFVPNICCEPLSISMSEPEVQIAHFLSANIALTKHRHMTNTTYYLSVVGHLPPRR